MAAVAGSPNVEIGSGNDEPELQLVELQLDSQIGEPEKESIDGTIYWKGFEVVKPICQSLEPDLRAKDLPFPRSGHRLVANDRFVVAIGGFNPSLWNEHNTAETYYPILKEIWLFNLATSRWEQVATSGNMPKEMASHAALLHDNHVLVYGGTGVPFGHNSTNKLNVLNMKTKVWRLVPMASSSSISSPTVSPPEQYGHAFVRNRNKLYINGGTSGFDYNMQVYELEMKYVSADNPQGGYSCRSLVRGPEAYPRYRHEAFYFKQRVHVLGGGRTNSVCGLDNVDVFEIKTGLWSVLPIQPDPSHGIPRPRRCHGLAVCDDQSSDGNRLSVFICGGYDGAATFNDVWELKLSCTGDNVEYKWCKFPHNLPRPLYFHGMTATPSGSLFVFGGVDGDTEERSASLYRCYLKPPTLLEQSLRKVISLTGNANTEELVNMATKLDLPRTCVEWLKSDW